ncbi:MAG: ExeA family protein [Candidatus Omnitrophota bacterium]
MFENYYGFKKKPFSLTPDPEFFYLSQDHMEAIEHLIYGISEGEGFLLLAGEIGTGKTTLCRVITQKLRPSIIYSMVLNPFQDFPGLLQSIIKDFGLIPKSEDKSDLMDQLIGFLLNEVGPKGKTALIIIDEAQNLSVETLEQLRLLSNIETNKEKLIQILLLGQEELIQKLELKELRQLNQRISVKYFLTPLKKKEATQYIAHRIQVGNPLRKIKFTRAALRRIYKYTRGVPRLINMLAHRCLVAGFVTESSTIDRAMVKRAKESLFGGKYDLIRKIKDKGYESKDLDPEMMLPNVSEILGNVEPQGVTGESG